MGNELTVKSAHEMIERLKPQMAMALPKHMTADRLARIALTELRQVPKLQMCKPESFMKCLMVSAQLGLEPGLLGHVYFIPYGKEAQLIIGYKGMIDLARRSGQVESIEARAIHANDKCDIKYGLESTIEHIIDPFCKTRGEAIGYYAVAKLVGGGHQFEFMTKSEIDDVRKSSKAGSSGPWASHYDAMAKKTVIRRLFKYLPVSVELQKAIVLDENQEVGKQHEVINADFAPDEPDKKESLDVDPETGEIIPAEVGQTDYLAAKIGG